MNGKITLDSIELVNFMCHSHTKVSFNKMITCIGGRNGAGKSAIMIALGIVFGQTASKLDRGSNYKNLIKTGTNQAIITVTINNFINFNKKKYGKKIIIEKKLRGTSSILTISSSCGKSYKATRKDLDAIVEAFYLKFDNPLNFLTQEKSKKFLNISNPSDLYDFYYEGTEFKNIEEEIEESQRLLSEMTVNINDSQQELEYSKCKLEENLDKLEFINVDHMQMLRDLEREEKWRNVNDKSEELKRLDDEILKMCDQISNKDNEKGKLSKAKEEKAEEKSTVEILNEIADLRNSFEEVDKDYKELIEDIQSKNDQIDKIKTKSSLADVEREYKNLENSLEANKKRLLILEDEKERVALNYEDEKRENKDKRQRKAALENQLNYLRNNQDPYVEGLRRQFAKVQSEINNTRFKDSVVGPLCEYIKLKDHKWYKAASIILKNSLFNYLVFNKEDKNTLGSIFKRLGVNFTIVLQPSKKPINYRDQNSQQYKENGFSKNISGKSHDMSYNSHPTLLDILDLKDDLVANQLIIIHSVERIILIEDRETAYSTVKKNPPNVDSAYTLNGDRIKCVEGSLSDYKARDDGKYWFEDDSSKIKSIANEISRIVIKDSIKEELVKIFNQYEKIKAEIEDQERLKATMEVKVESLRILKENDYESIIKVVVRMERQADALKLKSNELKNKLYDANERKNEIDKENIKRRQDHKFKQDEIFAAMARLDGEIIRLEQLKGSKILEKRELKVMIDEEIRELGDPIENPRSLEVLYREKKIVKNRIAEASKMESKDDIMSRVKDLKKKIRNCEKMESRFRSSLEQIKIAYGKRILKRDEIKDNKTAEAANLFREYTSRNGYEGYLVFDHANKKLELSMKVHNAKYCGSKSTLSGGERSFAGVCFLLSLWRSFRCPVKVLDEFDVFMDSLNRKVAINALFEFFKENEMQVILITPLDTSDLVDEACEIKVLNRNSEN